MKVSIKSSLKAPSRRQIVPVIPLSRPEAKGTLGKGDYTVIKCKTTPNSANSATYDLPIPYFRSGSTEEYLKWKRNVNRALTGQGISDGPGKYNLTRKLLDGDALMVFNVKATQIGSETNAHYEEVMDALTAHVFPIKALQTQKRFMRRFLRKPREMKARDFVSRVCEINEMLNQFPGANGAGSLPQDELLDLMEFGMPSSWQRQMIMHDFDPMDKSIPEFINMCERIEMTEPETKKVSINDEVIPRKKRKSNSGSILNTKGKYCMLHGECGHSTDECRTMQRHSSALKEKYKRDFKNTKRDQEVHSMFKEVMAQYMDKFKKNKRAGKKKTEAELRNFEHLNLDESSSEEEEKREEEEEVDDIFGNDDDSFSDLAPMSDL